MINREIHPYMVTELGIFSALRASFNEPDCFFEWKIWSAKYLLEGLMLRKEKKGFEIAKNVPFSASPHNFRRGIRKSWSRKATETNSVSYANTYFKNNRG